VKTGSEDEQIEGVDGKRHTNIYVNNIQNEEVKSCIYLVQYERQQPRQEYSKKNHGRMDNTRPMNCELTGRFWSVCAVKS